MSEARDRVKDKVIIILESIYWIGRDGAPFRAEGYADDILAIPELAIVDRERMPEDYLLTEAELNNAIRQIEGHRYVYFYTRLLEAQIEKLKKLGWESPEDLRNEGYYQAVPFGTAVTQPEQGDGA